jgi:hypothetical protein
VDFPTLIVTYIATGPTKPPPRRSTNEHDVPVLAGVMLRVTSPPQPERAPATRRDAMRPAITAGTTHTAVAVQ